MRPFSTADYSEELMAVDNILLDWFQIVSNLTYIELETDLKK